MSQCLNEMQYTSNDCNEFKCHLQRALLEMLKDDHNEKQNMLLLFSLTV